MSNIVKYEKSSLYITTDHFCQHCKQNNYEVKGTIKYQVLEAQWYCAINGYYVKRLYSVICNNDKCLYYKKNITIKAETPEEMIINYQKIITKKDSKCKT